jgi:hypothetical protein
VVGLAPLELERKQVVSRAKQTATEKAKMTPAQKATGKLAKR